MARGACGYFLSADEEAAAGAAAAGVEGVEDGVVLLEVESELGFESVLFLLSAPESEDLGLAFP